jgi:hypothetical protein
MGVGDAMVSADSVGLISLWEVPTPVVAVYKYCYGLSGHASVSRRDSGILPFMTMPATTAVGQTQLISLYINNKLARSLI